VLSGNFQNVNAEEEEKESPPESPPSKDLTGDKLAKRFESTVFVRTNDTEGEILLKLMFWDPACKVLSTDFCFCFYGCFVQILNLRT